MRPTGSSPARRFGRIFRSLAGRYPATMLGGWSQERIAPFQTLIGTILSARCRDETTDRVARALFARYPTAARLAAARPRDLYGLLRPIGFYRMKARYVVETSRLLLERHGGEVPRTLGELTGLPGVGRKVANCVLVYAFGQEAIPVDTHVHRVSNRLGWVKTRTPEETERALVAAIPRRLWPAVNELLVAHGKAVCQPIRPRCGECAIAGGCPTARGVRGGRSLP